MNNIRDEMKKYPILSLHRNLIATDEHSFQDDALKGRNKQKMSLAGASYRRNETITHIYDRISTNNSNDPLYPSNTTKQAKKYSSLHSSRNSKKFISQATKQCSTSHNKTVDKFLGEFSTELARKQSQNSELQKSHKLTLLRRIIEHCNLRSNERKYYSNLIKEFDCKQQSVNNTELVVKKDLHPRTAAPRTGIEQGSPRGMFITVSNNLSQCGFFEGSSNDRRLNLRKNMAWSSKTRYEPNKVNKNFGLKFDSNKESKCTLSREDKLVQKPMKLHSSGSAIEDKINKYREFLFVLNLSNNLYRDLDVAKYPCALQFYVGQGNNKNLIKSLMKKRFWFKEVSEPIQADFIWTQLKNQSIFQSQQSISRDNYHIISKKLLKFKSPTTTEPQKTGRKGNGTEKATRTILKFHKKSNARSHEPKDPFQKIVAEAAIQKYGEICREVGGNKNQPFLSRLRFCKGMAIDDDAEENRPKIHNHIPRSGLLGNKKAMYYNLREYCRLTDKQLNHYIPLTFHIKKGFLDPEYGALAEVFQGRAKKKEPNYWIIKPGQFTNRGQGISCANRLQQIRSRVRKCQQHNKNRGNMKSTLIVQQYISNPLLYNSRKFDIRVFMLLTMHNGKLKAYWYQEGYVRTSSFLWTLDEIEDKYIHLTNDAVQKTCEEYGLYEPGNKISFSELQRYLDTLPSYGRNLSFFEVIYPRMREVAADLVKATFVNLDPERLRDNFEILGLDFMIDHEFSPWLIEVNTNPCLELSCPLLQRMLPHMVENALRICVDSLYPPPTCINQEYKYAIPENALHYNKFQLIFDQQRDGAALSKLYENSTIMCELDDYEEDQEVYEQEGEMLQLNEL